MLCVMVSPGFHESTVLHYMCLADVQVGQQQGKHCLNKTKLQAIFSVSVNILESSCTCILVASVGFGIVCCRRFTYCDSTYRVLIQYFGFRKRGDMCS